MDMQDSPLTKARRPGCGAASSDTTADNRTVALCGQRLRGVHSRRNTYSVSTRVIATRLCPLDQLEQRPPELVVVCDLDDELALGENVWLLGEDAADELELRQRRLACRRVSPPAQLMPRPPQPCRQVAQAHVLLILWQQLCIEVDAAAAQAEGRLSNIELADRVGLSPSPCLRRVRRLEEAGVISGYRAIIEPAAVDRGFQVLVHVTMEVRDRLATMEAFEARVAELDEVIECRRMFGDPDYLL